MHDWSVLYERHLAALPSTTFQEDEARHSIEIRRQVLDPFSFFDSPGHPRNRLIGIVLGGRRAAAFKELHQLPSNRRLLLTRTIPIGIKREEEAIERAPSQRHVTA